MFPNILLYFSIFLSSISNIKTTIDLNESELQYLADHLTPEECRRLVAAAHFKQLDEPKVLDKAERKMPKDISCIEHLNHWNSQLGEGKGETHEILGHRLRQMGKHELADWLGKTVFHELGQDLEKGLERELDEFLTEESYTENENVTFPSLMPKIEDPTTYSFFDSVLYMVAIGLIITVFSICFMIIAYSIKTRIQKRKVQKAMAYEYIETDGTSESGSEDKFDVRAYTFGHQIN